MSDNECYEYYILHSDDLLKNIFSYLTFDKLTPNCNELLIKCQWEGKDIECGEIFFTRLTNDGFCCSFNNVRPLDFSSNTELSRQVTFAHHWH